MILVDSSALIEYYRPAGSAAVRKRVADAIAADQVATIGVIQVEILGFLSQPAAFRKLAADFEVFHWLEVGRKEYLLACELGLSMRQHGFTVPATDLIIAAAAIRAGALLYHLDAHYDQIASWEPLNARNLIHLRE
jgi:predicted nucleic acid-binding protein